MPTPERSYIEAEIEELQGLFENSQLTNDAQRWTYLKFRQLQEQLHPETLLADIKKANEEAARRSAELSAEIDQLRLQVQASTNTSSSSAERANEEAARRFAELSAEIDQLRLQVQASTNTSSSSADLPTPQSPPAPPPAKPHFFFESRAHLPVFDGRNKSDLSMGSIKEVFDFITQLVMEFQLRNRELRLPTDSTDGWASNAVMQLKGNARTWAKFKWGLNPNVSWEAFKELMISNFIPEAAIQRLVHESSNHHSGKHGNDIASFNNSFRELRLLLAFVGKDSPEKAVIQIYIKGIAPSGEPALALSQLATAERVAEGRELNMSLEAIMMYCEDVYHNSRSNAYEQEVQGV